MVITEIDQITSQTNYVGFNQRFSHLRDRDLSGEERDALLSVEHIMSGALVFPSLKELEGRYQELSTEVQHIHEEIQYCVACITELCIAQDLSFEAGVDDSSVSLSLGIYIAELHRWLRELGHSTVIDRFVYRRTRGLHLPKSAFQDNSAVDWRSYTDVRLGVFLLPLDIYSSTQQVEQLTIQFVEQCLIALLRVKVLIQLGEHSLARDHIRMASRLTANIPTPAFKEWSTRHIQSLHQILDA